MVHVVQLCVAGSVCFYVAHVALVSCGCVWPGMRLISWIEMPTCGTAIGCAAIAEFMDMKAMLTGRQPRNFCMHLHAVADRRECYGTGDFIACGGMQYRNTF